MTETARGDRWILARGDWRDVTPEGFWCDALITDPPYSERTHVGNSVEAHDGADRSSLAYRAWQDPQGDLGEILQRVKGWSVVITDHVSYFRDVEPACEASGRYVFAPVPIVSIGGRIRLAGDGPSSWTVWCCMSRPRSMPWAKWGTLPGAYIERGSVKGAPIVGCKQLDTMRKIVRDYTRPDDVVWDPFAGTGTTLLAAVMEGRRAVGAELDPETWAYAVERLRAWDAQPNLPGVEVAG